MIELRYGELRFSFPEVHADARLSIQFQRTLRIPDDGDSYPLPPGLGQFQLKHVDDYAAGVPAQWLERGGVMMPMYQSEALWIHFRSHHVHGRSSTWPFAIKVATGKQCAVSGESWTNGISQNPQNYVVAPKQPWLDGYVVEKGYIRQFVAMPLGGGFTAEEQITGKADYGGLQLQVFPMKRDVYEQRFPIIENGTRKHRSGPPRQIVADQLFSPSSACRGPEMGLAPGGRMKQEIYDDQFNINDWDMSASSRCFIHICNSLVWKSITGTHPPHPAPTAKEYTSAKLPWFVWYDETGTAISPTETLQGLKSVTQISVEKNTVALPENESVSPNNIVSLRNGLKPGQVREGIF